MRESDLIRSKNFPKDKQIFEPSEEDTSSETEQKEELVLDRRIFTPIDREVFTPRKSEVEPTSEAIVQKEEKVEISAIGTEQFVELYSKGIEILHKISEMEALDTTAWHEILDFISEVVDITVENPSASIDVAINHSGHLSLTSAHNIMDTSLLAINIGIGLDYSKDKLVELGTAAFLHGIDLQKLEGIDEVIDDIKMGIYQAHERTDGSGYPEGIKGQDIHQYAQIIGVADTYQALTSRDEEKNRNGSSPREIGVASISRGSYRPEAKQKRKAVSRRSKAVVQSGNNLPHEAMKMIISDYRKLFNPQIIRTFVNQVSIYPIGSLIQLNNGGIAKVVYTNKNSPLRPRIAVLFDKNGKRLKDKKIIDLVKELILHIKKSINPDEVGIDVSDILKI